MKKEIKILWYIRNKNITDISKNCENNFRIFKKYEFYNQRIYVQYVYLLILSLNLHSNFYTKLIEGIIIASYPIAIKIFIFCKL